MVINMNIDWHEIEHVLFGGFTALLILGLFILSAKYPLAAAQFPAACGTLVTVLGIVNGTNLGKKYLDGKAADASDSADPAQK
jgi:hypothetical protein